MPEAGVPCMVSRTCVVNRGGPAIPVPFISGSSDYQKKSVTFQGVRRDNFTKRSTFGPLVSPAPVAHKTSNLRRLTMRYPRNMLGYGRTPPDAKWPGGAYVAVQIVLNYEEGGENNVLHRDAASEAFLVDVIGTAPWPGQRHANVESMYEYGARAGFRRFWRYFTALNLPVTVYGVATALMRAPQQLAAMMEANWEIASHGYKWIQHKDMPAEEERQQIAEAIRLHTLATGERPTGWY